MEIGALGKRFWETTRGQVLALLRRGAHTVEDLARSLGITDNAVRSHLTSLERAGLIRQEGVRRAAGAGKPAVLYELRPEAAPLLSRAYSPVLTAMVGVLVDELPAQQSDELLRQVGRRLGDLVGGRASGDLPARVNAAAGVLTALGGDVQVDETVDGHRISGSGCPLSTVVSHRPEMCAAVEALVGEVTGETVKSCCEHGSHPRCCFTIGPAEPTA